MGTDVYDALRAEIERSREIALGAAAAKPGVWRAIPTHDGIRWDGNSRVLAEETTDNGGETCRFVADRIYDSLTSSASDFTAEDPLPAVVAVHIALQSPLAVVRRCDLDLKTLDRHERCPRACDLHSMHPQNWCHCCDTGSPCTPLRDLLDAYLPEVPR